MRMISLLMLGAAIAGCNQTMGTAVDRSAATDAKQAAPSAPGDAARNTASQNTTARNTASRTSTATQLAHAESAAQRCADAAKDVADKQMQAAMLGGALSMAGGLGGFAGQGGTIAAQAASVGGSLVQQHAGNEARTAMQQECR